jgi:hypothetical protein
MVNNFRYVQVQSSECGFQGTVALAGAANVWNSFAPMSYKFHAWLALRRRCWTADRLLRRGLPSHTLCPLCRVHDETLDHLSLDCPFAKVVWADTNSELRTPLPSPAAPLSDWWPEAVERKTANSLISLVIRSLWLERNARVFDKIKTSPQEIVRRIRDEWHLWLSSRGLGRPQGEE